MVSATEGSGLQHLLIFDITHDSHFTNFIRHWIHQWLRAPRGGARLSFVVDNYVLQRHSELTRLMQDAEGNVQLIELSPDEKRSRKSIYSAPERSAIAFHRLINSREAHRFGGF